MGAISLKTDLKTLRFPLRNCFLKSLKSETTNLRSKLVDTMKFLDLKDCTFCGLSNMKIKDDFN